MPAQEPATSAVASPSLLDREELAFRSAVDLANACVVQIETFGGLERLDQELVAEGPTTGTILSADGWIISSLFSFRQQPASILVTLPDGKRAAARMVARDFSRELALLKVDTDQPLPSAVPAETLAAVGSWAIALGKTYDSAQVSQSVGIISALGRAYGKAIQTDAKVSPVNYGGPLIDLRGQVLGILSPISPGTFFEGDSSELYDSGIGFAIPLRDILDRLPRMQKGEDIQPGKLGIVSSNQNELAGPVRLTGAAPGSPAAKAGFQPGDVIVEAGGQPIQLLTELRHALAQVDAGQSQRFVVRRGEQRVELECELVAEIPIYRRRYLGLRLEEDQPGLLISGVEAGSPAAQAGLVVGEKILSCNGAELSATQQLASVLGVAELDVALNLEVQDPSGAKRAISLLATTWPTKLPSELPAVTKTLEPNAAITVIDVRLGDVPNQVYALVPPDAATRSQGLLMLFPEPGELDREKTKAFWSDFCLQHGWIVAVIQSANPRAWSMEEVELAARVLGRMDQAYRLDISRCVMGGIGVGGRLALVSASMERERVAGVLTLGTQLGKMDLKQRNAPMQSLDFLLVGEPEKLIAAAEALSESGYAANVLAAPGMKGNTWESTPREPITYWLEGLGRL